MSAIDFIGGDDYVSAIDFIGGDDCNCVIDFIGREDYVCIIDSIGGDDYVSAIDSRAFSLKMQRMAGNNGGETKIYKCVLRLATIQFFFKTSI